MAVPVLNPPKSILWVDDEGELLEPHRIFLRSKGYTVEWASNADDAVELLRRRPFDILLLDEQMPGRRGLEVYRDVREIAPTLPVVRGRDPQRMDQIPQGNPARVFGATRGVFPLFRPWGEKGGGFFCGAFFGARLGGGFPGLFSPFFSTARRHPIGGPPF